MDLARSANFSVEMLSEMHVDPELIVAITVVLQNGLASESWSNLVSFESLYGM